MLRNYTKNTDCIPSFSAIVNSLGGSLQGSSQALVFCPAHDNKNSAALSLSLRNGSLFWHCHAGCRQEDVLDRLISLGILPNNRRRRIKPPLYPDKPPIPPKPRPKPILSPYHFRVEEEELQKKKRLERAKRAFSEKNLWIIHNYIEFRGLPLGCPSLDIGSCSSFPDKQKTKQGSYKRFPAMIAKIRDEESFVIGYEIHFLQKDGKGKAPVEATRKIYGRMKGGCVWLREEEDFEGELWLCEGVMTGLALQMWIDKYKPGGVVCACLSANNLVNQVLPRNTKKLYLALDNDEKGAKEGKRAFDKFKKQVHVEFRCPPKKGDDWLDALKGRI